MTGRLWAPAAAAILAFGLREALRRRHSIDVADQVVLITGSSRGLGFALAQELALRGARLVLCARGEEGLERARQRLAPTGADILTLTCDVSDKQQVQRLVQAALARFGRIDVLINNAGIISVGPLATQTLADFEEAMRVMFWGAVYATLEVLPAMRARGDGHIVNITSIGGKVSVPHLAPYASAKFAAVGFSEGIAAELARDGVHVLTVVPGLMRTGSHINAWFKGQNEKEFGLFSVLAGLPVSSMDAERAARAIVEALERGESEIILTWQAALLARAHGLLPGFVVDVLGLINRTLPAEGGIGSARTRGRDSRGWVTEPLVTALGDGPADRFNQHQPG